MNLHYEQNLTSLPSLLLFYKDVDNYFIPPLSSIVKLDEYVKKLYRFSERFEAYDDKKLIGLIACYANDDKKIFSFITSVVILPEYRRKGICEKLMRNCLNYLQKREFKKVALEVFQGNIPAQRLYKKANFIEVCKNSKIIKMEKDLQDKTGGI